MKIYELLNSETRWTRNVIARDTNNQPVNPHSKEACKWCLVGAIHKCYQEKVWKIIDSIENEKMINSLDSWNDTHTYKEVMELVRELNI